jgi:RNA polymerase sigma-70 factor (ECF subfamily)
MGAVFRLSLAITGSEVDAADVSQDAFVSAWRSLRSLRDPASFDGWLRRIVVNRARMAIRGRRRRALREIPTGTIEDVASAPVTDAAVLIEALDSLDPDRRTILALHYLEGRSIEEMAAILAVPPGTVKSRLFAARRALSDALGAGSRSS